MRVFGLGTAAALASRERYGRFTCSMHAVYLTMERSLDECQSPAVRQLWKEHGDSLRRAEALKADLDEVGQFPCVPGNGHQDDGLYFDNGIGDMSEATESYLQAIHDAALDDDANGGGRLIGHVYCRYFADLFGGQALAKPTRWALNLGPNSPRHYDFGAFGADRRRSIEAVYSSINAAGEMLDEAQRAACIAEARTAFGLNVQVYNEEPLAMDAMRGMMNVALGMLRTTRT
jgi:heme oxygenase